MALKLVFLVLGDYWHFFDWVEIEFTYLAFHKIVSFITGTIVSEKSLVLLSGKGVIQVVCGRGDLLMKVLVPRLLKRWESVIDNVG